MQILRTGVINEKQAQRFAAAGKRNERNIQIVGRAEFISASHSN